jgi:putative hydrolase of the HAD superfamily
VSPLTPVRALFFDLDDTLLDNSRFPESIVRTCEKVAASYPGLDAASLAEANRQVWQRYWPEVEPSWTLGKLTGASVNLEAWRRSLRACGCTDDAVARLASQAHGQFQRDTLHLFDDVTETFIALRRNAVRTALITNGASDTQRYKLQGLNIESWFDAIVISGEVGIAKPDQAVFDLALDRTGVERESVWHVGDSLTTDVAGARAAGIAAVWLNRRGVLRRPGDPEPDAEIRTLTDLQVLWQR